MTKSLLGRAREPSFSIVTSSQKPRIWVLPPSGNQPSSSLEIPHVSHLQKSQRNRITSSFSATASRQGRSFLIGWPLVTVTFLSAPDVQARGPWRRKLLLKKASRMRPGSKPSVILLKQVTSAHGSFQADLCCACLQPLLCASHASVFQQKLAIHSHPPYYTSRHAHQAKGSKFQQVAT